MDSDQAIYQEFSEGDLSFIDAIERLQRIGIDPKEAERMVSEWADGLDDDGQPD